jgi:hypothetical protein
MKNEIPIYMRSSISEHIRRKNPEYKELFHKCTSCDKFSLKPMNMKNIDPTMLKQISNNIARKCTLCGYIYDPNATKAMWDNATWK